MIKASTLSLLLGCEATPIACNGITVEWEDEAGAPHLAPIRQLVTMAVDDAKTKEPGYSLDLYGSTCYVAVGYTVVHVTTGEVFASDAVFAAYEWVLAQ